ncbi:hypothetical protein COLO4_18348 [Corchorus olitorius]|uniref:Sieve element occlusion C-terminal domain-containing protein n=1 Tax=Corchorus olitorius TaxID=93759 RepID=A0A1R3J9K8_9ROSI|nr:hypothetical protein COLO4_18348 [Corchorus olitorius]
MESESQLRFWRRLESIFHAKIQLGKSSKTDRIMRDVMKVLSYDSTEEGWAIFAMGSETMVTTNGEMALTIMSQCNYWRMETVEFNLLYELKTYMTKMPQFHGCIHVHMPVLGHMPRKVICPECSKQMEMYYTYH